MYNLKEKVMQTLNKAQIPEKDMTEEEEMFSISQNAFLDIDSEYKRIKALEESTCYIKLIVLLISLVTF